MADRRINDRITWRAGIDITDPITQTRVTSDARLRNLARRGFAFVSQATLIRGRIYDFKINMVACPLDLKAKVVHLKNEGSYFVAGAKIQELGFFQRARFNRFLAGQSTFLRRAFTIYSIIGAGVVFGFLYYLFGFSIAKSLIGFLIGLLLLTIFLPF